MQSSSISIVIPTYNNTSLLENCIESLLSHVCAEIIVVDNGSKEQSLKVFSQNITYVRFPNNTGFAYACNIGARIASNDIVLFLNNDTIVFDNFVPRVLDAFKPGIGMVGAKLLYADGTIQHAGISFWVDDDGKLQGRNDKYDRSAGEVVAVTGACMAVRKHAFFSSGGFDESYWNGNEDVDLCLTMRRDGWKIHYDPLFVVTHLESQSGPERWRLVSENVDRLTQKWKHQPGWWNW